MPFSSYLAGATLEHITGKTTLAIPTNYLGLSSTTPTAGGANITEPAGGGYARVATSAASWGTASAGSITNTATLTFPTATADWVSAAPLTYGVAFDGPSTGGRLLYYGALTTAKPVLNGDTVSIAPGGVTISLA